jgi:hypothetical protein
LATLIQTLFLAIPACHLIFLNIEISYTKGSGIERLMGAWQAMNIGEVVLLQLTFLICHYPLHIEWNN